MFQTKDAASCCLVMVLLLSLCVGVRPSSAFCQTKWKPAIYRNLVMGKSTRKDLLRTLGKPKLTAIPEGQLKTDRYQENWYYYDLTGEIKGKLTAYVDKRSGVMLGISLLPDKFSKDDMIQQFGSEFVETRYQFCQCTEESDAAPVYETPEGSLVQFEYRSRGIAIHFHDGTASIEYLDSPFGLINKAQCKLACKRN